jgi:signal transduction histidine kinase
MSATNGFRHLLDPLLGDMAAEPDRPLRLNLRRVELASIAMIFNAAVEVIFSFVRNSIEVGILAVAVIIGGGIFIVVARRDQRQEIPTSSHLPETYVVFALLCSQAAGYFIALGGRIPLGYALVYLAAAVFFLIPPRRFAMIGIGTFALFNVWVFSLDNIFFDKLVASFNTGLAVVAGIFGRIALDRMQQVDRQQRVLIAEQNEALVEANRRLATHNAELNDLMAIAAHDLRSPLFGLGNLLELAAARPPASPGALRDLFREASDSVAAMLGLIGRLLEAHEAEGRVTRTLQSQDLRRVLAASTRRIRAMAESSRIVLAIIDPPQPVRAMVDADALDQILDNLISNAIHFSPPASTVRLVAGIADGAFIEVIDEGIGIPPLERADLFGKFRRGSSHPLNGPRGSGLGLYIARTLANAMNAEISYRPADTGGSTFRIEFKATSLPDASNQQDARQRIASGSV